MRKELRPRPITLLKQVSVGEALRRLYKVGISTPTHHNVCYVNTLHLHNGGDGAISMPEENGLIYRAGPPTGVKFLLPHGVATEFILNSFYPIRFPLTSKNLVRAATLVSPTVESHGQSESRNGSGRRSSGEGVGWSRR